MAAVVSGKRAAQRSRNSAEIFAKSYMMPLLSRRWRHCHRLGSGVDTATVRRMSTSCAQAAQHQKLNA